MKRENATIGAFLTAPLITAIAGVVIFPVAIESDIYGKVFWLLMFYFFSTMLAVLMGLPAFYLLRHLRLIRWWSVIIAGFIIGAIVALSRLELSIFLVQDILIMGSSGGAAGFVFWLIWSRGRDE
jgi:hypothetical protein